LICTKNGRGNSAPQPSEVTMAAKKKHPGFKAAQKDIAKKEGISEEQAGAILASSSRKASPAAKKKNPNLKKVK